MLAFNLIWFTDILNVYLEEQLLIKYYMIKHLILQQIPNMMDINVVLLQWFINFWIKILLLRMQAHLLELELKVK